MKKILVTGGVGYIGSHTAWLLVQQGYEVIILDDLRHGQTWPHKWALLVCGNVGDRELLNNIFEYHSFDAVLHFAASIEVSESVKRPIDFYDNNVSASQTIIATCLQFGVKKFIFSSSCAVYGIPQTQVLTEDHPCNPISPYGRTKLMVEQMLTDCAKAYDFRYVSLRYFNAAGSLAQEGLYEQHVPETHVIPLMIDAAQYDHPFTIYGSDYPTPDGTAVRDYIHVLDIADAHIKALQYLDRSGDSQAFNLGTGTGFSVASLASALEGVVQKKLSVVYGPRRAGDPAFLVANSAKARDVLQWIPLYSNLDTLLYSAYEGRVKKGPLDTKFLRNFTRGERR